MSNAPVHLVTGATGKVGREVVRALTARGAEVRNGSRRRDGDGADQVWLDFADPTSFRPALEGVQAVFLMRPPAVVNVAETLNVFLDEAVAMGVEACTFMSIAGADRQKRLPHRKVQDHLRTLPIKWTILGPGFFDQNFTDAYLPEIRAGELSLPAADAKVAFIDAFDIGEVAAIAMLSPDEHHGKAYHLTGPEALSFAEATSELSRQLGWTVRYRPVSALTYALGQIRAGAPLAYAAVLTMIHVGLRDGSGAEIAPDLRRLLGRQPTTFAQFVARSLPEFGAART